MVAPRFPLHVVYHPATAPPATTDRLAGSRDLVPWADPYIALLIRKLQDEVRAERAAQRFDESHSDRFARCEEIPSDMELPLDFEFPEGPGWSYDDPPPSQPR